MTSVAPDRPVRAPEARLAPLMFVLGFAYLLVAAGLIHRASQPDVTPLEMHIMYWVWAALWPVFLVEAAVETDGGCRPADRDRRRLIRERPRPAGEEKRPCQEETASDEGQPHAGRDDRGPAPPAAMLASGS